ncbi:MAG: hypothetical protein ACE5JS_19255 [Nitrospinota bacterium]
MKYFLIMVELEASNTFRVEAESQERAEKIALEAARRESEKLKLLGWDLTIQITGSEPEEIQ